MATVLWEIQMCAVPSHGIPIGITFLWTSLPISSFVTAKLWPRSGYRGGRVSETKGDALA